MSKKQLFMLVGAVLILLGITAVLVKKRDKSWHSLSAKGENFLPESFDVNSVAGLEIKCNDEKISLRKIDGKWKVENRFGYSADFSKISTLLLKLRDLKIMQEIMAGKSQFGRLGLLNPDKKTKDEKSYATLLAMSNNKGENIASIMLGKEHLSKPDDSKPYFNTPIPDGRYIMLGNTDKPVLVSDTLSAVYPSADDWLDKSFLKIDKIKSIEKVAEEKENSWKLSREKPSDTPTLSGIKKNEEENKSNTSDINSAFSYMSFEDVYSHSNKLPEKKLKKSVILKVNTFDGFSYLINIGITENKKTVAHFEVSAKFAEKRIPGKNEKKKESEKLDRQFAAKLENLKRKLSDYKKYSNWCYVFPKYKFKPFFRSREDLVKIKKQNKKNEKKK